MNASIADALRGDTRQDMTVTDGSGSVLDGHALFAQADELAVRIREAGGRTVGLLADNGPPWIVADLACSLADCCIVPLPLFFSDEQLLHVVRSAGINLLLTDRSARAARILGDALQPVLPDPHCPLAMHAVAECGNVRLPAGTRKVTFTSGTTGAPKGVCLSAAHQLQVARSLVEATGLERPKHLCLLPQSMLLENIAGVYAPLLAGGTVVAPALSSVGFDGSAQLDIVCFLECIGSVQPDSVILVPETLGVLVAAAERGWQAPASLRFVAVGGGKVSPSMLERADRVGLPVYEGYGLSECGSVVALNRPGSRLAGSVGEVLAHTAVATEDDEVVVAGASFLGYVNEPSSWYPTRVETGDLGRIDDAGRLWIDGRRKNVLITSYGRNVSPEWVESELLASGELSQAFVFGDAQPGCVALVHPRNEATSDGVIECAIAAANARLPGYARITQWYRLGRALDARSGLLTENGRPKRERIEAEFATTLAEMYRRTMEDLTA